MQGSGQPGPALHERFARAIAKTVMAPGFVIARPRRGRGNLAVHGRITGEPSAKSQLPARDCRGINAGVFCQSPWHSGSAAADTIVARCFNDGLYEL